MRLTLLLVCLVTVCHGQEPDLPDIWKVVEDSYKTQVLVTFPDLIPGVTMAVEEYYEISEQKGVVYILEHGLTTQINYYTSNEQVYVQYIENNTCEVGGLIDNAAYHLWGWVLPFMNGTEVNYVYGPSAILKLVEKYERQMIYLGQEDVRGIISDKWEVDIMDPRGNYTLTIYFASDLWLMPYGHTLDGIGLHSPVQIKVKGPEGNPWDSNADVKDQTVYYNYILFQPYISDDEAIHKFLTIDGLDCLDRENIDVGYEPAVVPSIFSVFLETIIENPSPGHEDQSIINKQWLYYNEPSKLLRVDINPDSDSEERHRPTKVIHDYMTGISHSIDKNTGACVMKVMSPDDFGNMIGSGIIGDVIMASPGNLFHLDDKYMFTGLKEERGLLTERWTSTRDDIRNPFQSNTKGEKFFKKAIVDYQFLQKTIDDPDMISGDDSVPVRCDVTVYDDDNPNIIIFRQKVNFMKFSSTLSEVEQNHFDVRECFTLPSQRTWFKITFVGTLAMGITKKTDFFKDKVITKIVEGTSSSLIRFPEIRVNKEDENIVSAIVLILEPAPYHLQFKQLDDIKPTDDDEHLPNMIDDVEICASMCLRYTHFQCKSFYECENIGSNCFLSNYGKPSPGTPIQIDKACKFYKKALVNKEPIQQSNRLIKEWIQGEISNENFNISLKWHYENETYTQTFMAVALEEELLADDPIFVDLIREDYNLAYTGGMLRYQHNELKLPKISYAHCLLSCMKQKSFECETFSYCYGDNNCYLSSHVVDNPADEADIIEKQDCVIISKSYLNDYQPYDGAIFMEKSKAKITATSDANKCAYWCSHREDFTCRSFDYCSDTMDCWLFDKHSMDFSDSLQNTSKKCSHFSRNELTDFEKHPNQVLKGSRDRYITDISVERCAHECVKDPDFGCKGFDFCNNIDSVTCFITQDHYSDDGVVISNDPSCDHYSREYFEGEDWDHWINHHHKDSKYIYGPGDMAGLGVSMLVISFAGTFAGVYLYNKYAK